MSNLISVSPGYRHIPACGRLYPPSALGWRGAPQYLQAQSARCPLEQTQQLFGNGSAPGSIEMAIALRVLAVDEDRCRHDQMKVILGAGHGDVEQSTFLSISAEVPAPRSEGMQPSTTLSR